MRKKSNSNRERTGEKCIGRELKPKLYFYVVKYILKTKEMKINYQSMINLTVFIKAVDNR